MEDTWWIILLFMLIIGIGFLLLVVSGILITVGATVTVGQILLDVAVDGDTNSSGVLNVADVIYLVFHILDSTTQDVVCGDMNNDGTVNVSDVTSIINTILEDRSYAHIDALNSKLIISETNLRLESDGFVQAVHIV